MIKSYLEIRTGDILIKDTDMDDKKSFFMKVINQLTSWFQGIPDGDDHSETLHRLGNIVRTSSSQFGKGVRTMEFRNWATNEGFPHCTILRRIRSLSDSEQVVLKGRIARDEGLPYALKKAIKAHFGDVVEPTQSELIVRGLFCSETTGKWNDVPEWWGMWPHELKLWLLSNGYYIIFDGDIYKLLK